MQEFNEEGENPLRHLKVLIPPFTKTTLISLLPLAKARILWRRHLDSTSGSPYPCRCSCIANIVVRIQRAVSPPTTCV